MEKEITREEVANMNPEFKLVMDSETHHNHPVITDEEGTVRWKQNASVRHLIDEKIDLNSLWMLFGALGLNKNSEFIRNLYRNMGYSINGYWEIFYWEMNNPIADEYKPKASESDYDNMTTELKARMILFHSDDHSKGFNEGLIWAVRLLGDYKKGEGILQQ